jgi:ribosome-binding protein aMBF1 (putative translation factor)
MTKLNKKLSELASPEASNWKAKAKYRRDNREWLKRSATIAIKVLDALKAQGLTQKELAERLHVSPQYINKIVKGEENLTLETITNLELALDIHIIICNSTAA